MVDIEGAPSEAQFVEAFGTRFEVVEKVALMPMLRFAHLAKRGAKADDMDSLDAMYDLLRAVFAEDDWTRFEAAASDARADAEELFGVVKDAMAVISSRPTKSPSVSSPGPQTTTPNSTDSSSFEERKRALGLVPVTDALSELAG